MRVNNVNNLSGIKFNFSLFVFHRYYFFAEHDIRVYLNIYFAFLPDTCECSAAMSKCRCIISVLPAGGGCGA